MYLQQQMTDAYHSGVKLQLRLHALDHRVLPAPCCAVWPRVWGVERVTSTEWLGRGACPVALFSLTVQRQHLPPLLELPSFTLGSSSANHNS